MRARIAGWSLTAVGIVAILAGLAAAVYLGPDGRRTTGPHTIDTDRSVVVTAPQVVRWVDTQVDVLAEVPVNKPVFVGLGNTVDVQSLVADVQRVEVTSFDPPWTIETAQREGERPTVQGAPTALDWWLGEGAGLGGASLSATLPDQPTSLAIVSIGDSNLSGLQVTMAYGVKGGFAKALGLVLLGLGAVLAGRVVVVGPGASWAALAPGRFARGPRARSAGGSVDDDVVFVVIDDDGVERELTAAEVEAGGYEVVDEGVPDPGPEGPDVPPPAEEVDQGADGEEEVFVWVDDDGVEHEIRASELGEDFVVVDDEDVEIVDDDGSDR